MRDKFNNKKPKIARKRHFAKTISWRIIGTVDTWIISFILVYYFGERKDSGVLSALFVLGTLVQNVCLSARRLHDRGHSGWWQLGLLVPFLNFMVIYWLARDAKDTPDALNYVNPYGARD